MQPEETKKVIDRTASIKETEETLTRLVFSGVSLMDLIVEPHVGYGHPVLGQRACLVRADGGGGAQSLHSLQVLYQAVLTSHSLGSECETHLKDRNDTRDKGKR